MRFIAVEMGDPELTAFVCRYLARGSVPPPQVPPLTNHPDGCASIVGLFQTFQREWGDDSDTFPITIDASLRSQDEVERDVASADPSWI